MLHAGGMGEIKYAHNILLGKPRGNKILGRPRRKWQGWV